MRLRYNLNATAVLILRLFCALEPLLYKSAGNPGSSWPPAFEQDGQQNSSSGYDAAGNYEPETGQVGWGEPTQEEKGQ